MEFILSIVEGLRADFLLEGFALGLCLYE